MDFGKIEIFDPFKEEQVTPPYIVDAGEETFSGNQCFWGGVEIRNGGKVTVETSGDISVIDCLTLADGAVLVNNGDFVAESIVVKGTGNEISGKTIEVRRIPTYHILGSAAGYSLQSAAFFSLYGVTVEDGAELTVSKDQYDAFGSLRADGSITVRKSAGNALRQKDIDKLISGNAVRHITFQQDLFDLKNLKFNAGTSLTVCFEDAYGTEKNDSIRFCKDSNITFGGEGKVIDLFEGKNRIRTDANAQVSVLSDIANVCEVQIVSGARTRENRITRQNFTRAVFHDVAFSETVPGTFSIGDYAVVLTGALTGGARSDRISVGHNSSLQTGDVRDFERISIASGTKWKEYSSDPQKIQGCTCWTAGNIESGSSLNLTAGDHTSCSVGDVKVGIIAIKLSSEDVWEIAAGNSNDVIRIGKNASFSAASVNLGNGKNSILAGAGSQLEIAGDAKGIWKLQISGTRDNWGTFSAEDVTCTDFSDLLSFGSCTVTQLRDVSLIDGWAERPGNDRVVIGKQAQFQASSLTFGKGNDRFEIGDGAAVNLSGLLDFGSGRDRLVIGRNAEVVLKAASADSLVQFSIGKDTEAYLSSELLACRKLQASKAQLHDIGSAKDGVAQNFTTLAGEQADDLLEHAAALTDAQCDGWLCGEGALDRIDCFLKGTATELVCGETSEALIVSQWDSQGTLLESVAFGGTVSLRADAEKISVGFGEQHQEDKAVAYHFTLTGKG